MNTDAVSVPGWSGAGYIITDPETGAYKIAGGGNGGFLAGILFGMSLFLFIALFFTLGALALLPAILLTILSITGALASFITANIILGLENIDISIRNGVSEPCVLSGVLSFLSLPLAYVSGGRGLLINWLFWLQPENFPNPRSCLDV